MVMAMDFLWFYVNLRLS